MFTGMNDRPGSLARRYQQIAVAIFHAEVGAAGCDLTPVQYAALFELRTHAGIDQATLAGLIAFDRTTIGGVIDRLEQRGYLTRRVSETDRRARVLELTDEGRALLERVEPAVMSAQRLMLAGLDEREAAEFLRLLRKAVEAGNAQSRAPLQTADAGA
jgi:MarR family transcriptional regulator, temperature-dependent positive regulator of motility